MPHVLLRLAVTPCFFQSVMNMMHVISIPYSLMKVNPLSWIQKVCQYKGASAGAFRCPVHSLLLSHGLTVCLLTPSPPSTVPQRKWLA